MYTTSLGLNSPFIEFRELSNNFRADSVEHLSFSSRATVEALKRLNRYKPFATRFLTFDRSVVQYSIVRSCYNWDV